CIDGYLKNKTRILVTHNLQFINKADKVIIINDGQCIAFGTPQQLINSGIDFASMTDDKTEDIDSNEINFEIQEIEEDVDLNEENSLKPIIKAVMSYDEYMESKEEAAFSGSVKLKVHMDYFKAGGNKFVALLAVFAAVSTQFLFQFTDYWLAQWMDSGPSLQKTVNDTEHALPRFVAKEEINNAFIYSALTGILIVGFVIRFGACIFTCLTSSIKLHNTIFRKLLRAPIAFFERNPKGRILNRFTGDMGLLDQTLPMTILNINAVMGNVVGIALLTCIINPYLII
ncbi:hypothetical protein B4U80_12222, partial [Leptotrombidium deliense]